MRRFPRILALAFAALTTVALWTPRADAGRIGGAMSTYATVPAYQSVYFDVAFFPDQQGIVTVIGDGHTGLNLAVYDGDAHIFVGTGYADRRMVVMNVYRAGFFRVEVYNPGPLANTFLISTN